jgi:hypothetical protein
MLMGRSSKSTRSLMYFCLFALLLFTAPISWAFTFGVNADNWSNQIQNPAFEASLKAMGVQFVVWHLSPEEEVAEERLMEIVNFCRRNGFRYLFNTELVNYVPGFYYFQQADGTYRYDLKKTTLDKLRNDALFLGVVYDEPMLMQSLNGVTVQNNQVQPYFAQTKNMDVATAHKAVVNKIGELARFYGQYGKRMIMEEVLPDYAHASAMGGALLAPKLLKENYNDLMFYMYAGAARQYQQKELWACIDLWFLDKFPFQGRYSEGCHTPEELYGTLRFAFESGIDYVYIEQAKGLLNEDFSLSPYGVKVVEFQVMKSGLTEGNWRSFSPRYIVKRYPSGYWGQQYSYFIPDHPYGSWKTDSSWKKSATAWLEWLGNASHHVIPPDADTWLAVTHPYFQKQPYQSLAGLPPMLVVDHLFNDFSRFPGATVVDLRFSRGIWPPGNLRTSATW